MYAGRVNTDSGVLEVAEAARTAPKAPQLPRSLDLVLDGLARRCTEGPSGGVPALRLALQAVRNEALDGHAEIMRWLLLTPIVQSMTVFELWDDDAFHQLATRAVRLARDTGALALLPVALVYRSGVHLFGGELVAAQALVEEADAIAAATGNASLLYAWLLSPRGAASKPRPRSSSTSVSKTQRHDPRAGWWRWPAMPAPFSTTAWAATRQQWTAQSSLATMATMGTRVRRCQNSSRPQPVLTRRRSPPPRWPGWKTGHWPRRRIPKDHGTGVRVLGVPTVADRVAQTAAAMLLEEKLEPIFHPDSYGYRPGRSAHDALAVTRRRCWKQDWVLDLDIRAFFDSVPHDLLLKAVAHHTQERWVLLYIERWLKAPMQMPDGTLVAREKGTPQGSPISPSAG